MPKYIYNDDDNYPMIDDEIENLHHVTGYTSFTEMRAAESGLPFTDPIENGCWNCRCYDWTREACTIRWNNMDDCYYNPDLDDHEPTYWCEDHDLDPDVKPEDWDFGGNEP